MQIKRFEAKSMTTALRMIKDELGPGAVILSARSLRKGKGFFGSLKYAGVEVSAAIDNQVPPSKNASVLRGQDPYLQSPNTRINETEATFVKDRVTRTGLPASGPRYQRGYSQRKKPTARNGARALSSLYQQILLQEVDRGIASELIEEIKRIPASEELFSSGDIRSHLSSILEDMGVVVENNPFDKDKSTVMAFVGTTGVGKTTTIAKLAALQVKRYKKSVGLITIDNYSIAGRQPLETYAQIIGIPLETVVKAAELKKAVKKFKDKEIILIDTPGINPKDQEQILELKALLAKVTGLQTQLVLSATIKEKDCIAIAEAFKEMGAHRILFTKTDESSVFGNIVNVLIRTNLPLSFFGSGRRVPDDIEAGSVQRLVDLLFQSIGNSGNHQFKTFDAIATGTMVGGEPTDKQPYFVANKNSDVYHGTDCKWAKKIKPGNMIKFTGMQEAEAQNFLPCKSCNPDRDQGVNSGHSKTEMRQYSSYR